MVAQEDTAVVEGSSAALPFPYSGFPVVMEMLCLLLVPNLQKGHLLKVGSPTVRAVATSYSMGFLGRPLSYRCKWRLLPEDFCL